MMVMTRSFLLDTVSILFNRVYNSKKSHAVKASINV